MWGIELRAFCIQNASLPPNDDSLNVFLSCTVEHYICCMIKPNGLKLMWDFPCLCLVSQLAVRHNALNLNERPQIWTFGKKPSSHYMPIKYDTLWSSSGLEQMWQASDAFSPHFEIFFLSFFLFANIQGRIGWSKKISSAFKTNQLYLGIKSMSKKPVKCTGAKPHSLISELLFMKKLISLKSATIFHVSPG